MKIGRSNNRSPIEAQISQNTQIANSVHDKGLNLRLFLRLPVSDMQRARPRCPYFELSRKSSGNHFLAAGGGGAVCGVGGGPISDWVGESLCSPIEGPGGTCCGLVSDAVGGGSRPPLRPQPDRPAAAMIAASMATRPNPNSGLCTNPTPPEPWRIIADRRGREKEI